MEPARYYRGAEKKKTKQTNKSFIFIYFFSKGVSISSDPHRPLADFECVRIIWFPHLDSICKHTFPSCGTSTYLELAVSLKRNRQTDKPVPLRALRRLSMNRSMVARHGITPFFFN